MEKWTDLAGVFFKQIEWKDLVLIKVCVLAVGILLGMAAPKKIRRRLCLVTAAIYCVTFIPLILDIIRMLREGPEEIV